MTNPRWRASRRDLLRAGGLAGLGAALPSLAACGGDSLGSSAAKQLEFMYWGSTFEKAAVQKMLEQFEAEHDGVTAKPLYTPNDYETKLNALVASKRQPDAGYLGSSTAYRLAENKNLLNLYDYVEKYPSLKDRMPHTYFWLGPEQLIGCATAPEIQLLWYNNAIFAEAGAELPPAEAAKAWDWDEFVEVAHKLTVDQNGKRADESGFDPTRIRQFGCSLSGGVGGFAAQAMLASHGTGFFNEDCTRCTLDSPEAIEVLQNIADLSYKFHVAPTATQLGNNAPTTAVQLQTKRIAMVVDGQWILLDLGQSDLDYGLGVLPVYDEPKTIETTAVTSVFADTEDPELAVELFMYHNDPAKVDLFKSGLWMPLQKKYYTEPAAIDSWTKNDVHPPEYRTAAVDYAYENSVRDYPQYLKNQEAISDVLTPGLQQIDLGKRPAAEVLPALAEKINPLLKGRYPTDLSF